MSGGDVTPTQADLDLLYYLICLEWLECDGRPNPDALSLIANHAAQAREEGARMIQEVAADEAERIGIRWAEDSNHPATSRAVGKSLATSIRAIDTAEVVKGKV